MGKNIVVAAGIVVVIAGAGCSAQPIHLAPQQESGFIAWFTNTFTAEVDEHPRPSNIVAAVGVDHAPRRAFFAAHFHDDVGGELGLRAAKESELHTGEATLRIEEMIDGLPSIYEVEGGALRLKATDDGIHLDVDALLQKDGAQFTLKQTFTIPNTAIGET